jgi:hypothetical protein
MKAGRKLNKFIPNLFHEQRLAYLINYCVMKIKARYKNVGFLISSIKGTT